MMEYCLGCGVDTVCEVGNTFAACSNLVGNLSSRYGNLIVADKPNNHSDHSSSKSLNNHSSSMTVSL